MDIEELRTKITNEADNLVERVNTWRDEMLKEVETAANNEILNELKKINGRLDRVEQRLPEEEAT